MKHVSMALASVLLAGAGAVGAASAATAADYPPQPPALSILGCSDVKTGVRVQIRDLLPRSAVTVAWDQAAAAGFITFAPAADSGEVTRTANSGGVANVTLKIDESGDYVITAVGTDAAGEPWTGATEVTVLESCSDNGDLGGVGDNEGDGATAGTGDGTSTGGLSDTGAGDTGMLLTLGLGALLLGATTVVVARWRRLGDADQA